MSRTSSLKFIAPRRLGGGWGTAGAQQRNSSFLPVFHRPRSGAQVEQGALFTRYLCSPPCSLPRRCVACHGLSASKSDSPGLRVRSLMDVVAKVPAPRLPLVPVARPDARVVAGARAPAADTGGTRPPAGPRRRPSGWPSCRAASWSPVFCVPAVSVAHYYRRAMPDGVPYLCPCSRLPGREASAARWAGPMKLLVRPSASFSAT